MTRPLLTHLQSVVALAKLTSTEKVDSIDKCTQVDATGFLYAFPRTVREDDGTDEFRHLWLVTCKHVVQGFRSDGADQMIVRMNLEDQQNMIGFAIPLQNQENAPKWHLHPAKDIAVIPASWQDLESKGVQWQTFAAERNAITRRDAADLGLSEGDVVFILGFPIGWREGEQDYPVVRHGILSQIRGWLKGEHETFLVDGSGFPGNSGGPVIVATPQVNTLIGMVIRRTLSPLPEGVLSETSDLIEVIPIEAINETIQFAMEQKPDSSAPTTP